MNVLLVLSYPNCSNGSDYQDLVRTVAEGSIVTLRCPSQDPFLDCKFSSPSGKVHNIGITGAPYKDGRVENVREVIILSIYPIDHSASSYQLS